MVVFLCSFWGLLIGLVPLRENDVFWHLTLGRAVARNAARSFPEPVGLSSEPIAHAPEWLWDLVMYGVDLSTGDFGLSVVVALLTALAAASIPWMLGRVAFPSSRRALGLWALASAIALTVASVRLKHRPETVSMALLGAFIVFSSEFARRPGWAPGLTLAMLMLVWAQLHGLFVLGPVVCALVIVPSARRPVPAMALLGVLCLLFFSSAYGLSIFDFVQHHMGGDAVRHIVDMRPPPWTLFDPRRMVFGPLALVELGLASLAVLQRRASVSTSLLALLGTALLLLSTRGMGPFAVLAAPAAHEGLRSLTVLRRYPASAFVVAGAVLVLGAMRSNTLSGPIGQMGFDPEETPYAVYSALALPEGTPVLTSYAAGAGVGFFTDGHVRVTLDSRSPLQFSSLDYALARDAFQSGSAMRAYVDAKGVGGAVVERGRPECETFARLPGMAAVAVESRYAAFLRQGPGVRPLATLDVCRPGLVTPRACTGAFDSDLEQLKAANPDFLRYLLVARGIRCGLGSPEPRLLSSWVEGSVLPGMREETALLASEGFAELGRWPEAAEAVSRLAEAGSGLGLKQLLSVSNHLAVDARQRVLERVCTQLDDGCGSELRTAVAAACEANGDLACAAFHSARAALTSPPSPDGG
jgi:hypothetical protein